jgi:hypothetical protein
MNDAIYTGRVTRPGEWAVSVREPDGKEHPLRHYVRHSPDGFAWGYGGSGPTELARCILIDATGVMDPGHDVVLDFRRDIIERLDKGVGFSLPRAGVSAWLRDRG